MLDPTLDIGTIDALLAEEEAEQFFQDRFRSEHQVFVPEDVDGDLLLLSDLEPIFMILVPDLSFLLSISLPHIRMSSMVLST